MLILTFRLSLVDKNTIRKKERKKKVENIIYNS